MSRRVTSLRIENYRSIRGRHTINLDAPVVLIHGANGTGKTSFLSALEMGLTGEASAMRRSDPNYAAYLIHRGADEAHIGVRCRHDAFEPIDSALTIRSGDMIGKPALPQHLRRLYTERCYLAQTTLSRLLDIYEQKSGKADDALTRFVRDLIGLDQFDNLLAGIHHTRHVTRLRKALPAYSEVEQEIDRQHRELVEIDKSLHAEGEHIASLNVMLNTELNKLDSLGHVIGTDLASRLNTEYDEKRAETLRGFFRDISSALAQWNDLHASTDLARFTAAESEAEIVERQWKAWRTQHYENVTRALTLFSAATAVTLFNEVDAYGEAVEDALHQIEKQAARINSQLKNDQEVEARLVEAREASEKSAERLTRLDRRIAVLSGDGGALARALSDMEPFLKDEICPVCHRDFNETDGPPLHLHVTEHISKLAIAAEDLRESTAQRQTEVRVKEAANLRIVDFENRRRADDLRAKDQKALTATSEARVALELVRDAAETGSRVLARRRQVQAKLSRLRRDALTLEGLRESILHYPTRLDLDSPTKGEGIEKILNRCGRAVSSKIEYCENQIAAKSAARQTLDKVTIQTDRVEQITADRVQRIQNLEKMEQALRCSNEIRDEARRLAGYVEEVRDAYSQQRVQRPTEWYVARSFCEACTR